MRIKAQGNQGQPPQSRPELRLPQPLCRQGETGRETQSQGRARLGSSARGLPGGSVVPIPTRPGEVGSPIW